MNAPTRYFTDGILIWKFEDGKKTQVRFKSSNGWRQSIFNGLVSFMKNKPSMVEINTEAGEP